MHEHKHHLFFVKNPQQIIRNLVSNHIGFTLRVNPWLWNWARSH